MAQYHDHWDTGEGTFRDTSSAVGNFQLRQDGYVFMDELLPFLHADLGPLPVSYAIATKIFNRNDYLLAQPIYVFNVNTVTKNMSQVFNTYPSWFKYNNVGNASLISTWYDVQYKLQDSMISWAKQPHKESNDLMVVVPNYVQFHIEKQLADMIGRKEDQTLFDPNRNLLNLPGHTINQWWTVSKDLTIYNGQEIEFTFLMSDHFLQRYQREYWIYKYKILIDTAKFPKDIGDGKFYTISGFHMFKTNSSVSSRASFDAATSGSPFTMVTDILGYDGETMVNEVDGVPLMLWLSMPDNEIINFMGTKITVKIFVQNLANVLHTPSGNSTLTKSNIQTALGIATAVGTVVPGVSSVIDVLSPTLNQLVSYLHLVNVGVNTVTAFCNMIIDSTPQLLWDTLDYIPPLFWQGYQPIAAQGATNIPQLNFATANMTGFKSEKDHTNTATASDYQYILTNKDKVIQNLERDIASLRLKVQIDKIVGGTLAPDVILTVRH